MSDISQGEGWWQASDLKWYPPDLQPGYEPAPPAPEAAPEPAPNYEPAPAPVPAATYEPAPALVPEPPAYSAPVPPPIAPAPIAPAPAPGPPSATGSNTKWIVAGVVTVAVVALGGFLLFGRGDDKKDNVASSNTDSSSSASSSRASSSTKSSSSSTPPITAAQLQARMLAAKDVGAGFNDGTFAVDDVTPTPCGQENLNKTIPPRVDVGSQSTDATTKAFFREEVSEYSDAATARRAFDLGTQGLTCTQGTLSTGAALTLQPPKDLSSTFGSPSVSIGFEVSGTTALVAVLVDNRIVSMQFQAPSDANVFALPDSVTVVKSGLTKLAG